MKTLRLEPLSGKTFYLRYRLSRYLGPVSSGAAMVLSHDQFFGRTIHLSLREALKEKT